MRRYRAIVRLLVQTNSGFPEWLCVLVAQGESGDIRGMFARSEDTEVWLVRSDINTKHTSNLDREPPVPQLFTVKFSDGWVCWYKPASPRLRPHPPIAITITGRALSLASASRFPLHPLSSHHTGHLSPSSLPHLRDLAPRSRVSLFANVM